ncbi:glucan endo-beta-glucosidase-like protein [Emericellopsis cladophorae]|uniref:glucan endo-1,3-beta-D-glucosidase n=1 Tax=Emericellopsis cladophorae TaxID=2686198 RepID=A0A9P9XZY1_9HYPO|nr:glucan endo-beta-glucosidase-like protein [Emericellopsis cladophorae]KAI6780555.1 glucan endo-beta-glucosidase-like protein [Emericellopsis cladophorae]
MRGITRAFPVTTPTASVKHPLRPWQVGPEGTEGIYRLLLLEQRRREDMPVEHTSRGNNSPMRSTTSSLQNYGPGTDPYGDDPYGYSSSNRSVDRRLGEVNPNDIEDDGDDGLHYPRYSQRNSMLSSGTSDRGARPAIGGTAAAGAGMGGYFAKSGTAERPVEYDLAATDKERSEWTKHEGMSKRKKSFIIFVLLFVIIGAIVGGVVGGMVANTDNKKDDANDGDSAKKDSEKNGVLDKNSQEIKDLMDNPELHRVFPGMDYTPINTQYPDCVHNPPSQNNVTRDMAVLSQLTNRVRTYGTDCNQTAMVIEAINLLDLKDDVKIWMGVWQDKNTTTNKRQLDQMYQTLEDYGDEHFEGLIVANEILFREEMDVTELGDLLDEVRTELDKMNLDLPVATSDLGDDWTSALADTSDYLMSNIHPFFSGVTADKAAAWTMEFFEDQNGQFFKTTGGKTDKKRNVISETGWPTGGGTNCGGASSCKEGSVAGVDELNTFMNDWICPALKNGTNYFWFSAFDEPWKVRFNEKGKEWEDKWGIMDVDRNLKKGVKIPDCDGQTVS